jgi:hypothetical protein
MGEGLFAAGILAWLSEDAEGVEDPGRREIGDSDDYCCVVELRDSSLRPEGRPFRTPS